MAISVWDYDTKKLQRSKKGALLLLERLINYGVYRTDKRKIPLKKVKKNWKLLHIEPKRRKLLHRLIRGI